MKETGLSSTGSAETSDDEQILSQFLTAVKESGFVLDLVNNGSGESPAWVGYWTFRGSSFEGFRQPPDQPDLPPAVLLACAALLQNEWCRARLPGLER